MFLKPMSIYMERMKCVDIPETVAVNEPACLCTTCYRRRIFSEGYTG